MTPVAQPQTSPTKLILPFMDAVRNVFKKMAGVDIVIGKPKLKDQAAASYNVCGIIGFSGDIMGSVVVTFSTQAAEKLVECFTGSPIKVGSIDFADAIGEHSNMIAGSAKTHRGGAASISLPSVVIGEGYTVANLSNTQCVVIPCNSPHGAFALEVCIKHSGIK